MESDNQRHRRIVQSFDVDDLVFLKQCPLPPWAIQDRRLAERNAVILQARAFLPQTDARPQARLLAQDLSRYINANWQRRDCPVPVPGTYRNTLHRLAVLNNGKPIGHEQIRKLFRAATSLRG